MRATMRRKQILYLVLSAALGLSVDFFHFFGSLVPHTATQAAGRPVIVETAPAAGDSWLSD
jgi:hypothetical protein